VSNANSLDAPDIHFVQAAEGWLELGLPEEALAELKQLSKDSQTHPASLNLLWSAHAELEEWEQARDAADRLVECAPSDAGGWIHRAYAIRRMKGGSIEEAWLALYPAMQLFPNESIIPYNLACYACQLGKLGEAKSWYEKAYRIPNDHLAQKTLKKMALEDTDLEALWGEIEKIE
tara:strand:+ start:1851 stop:2378 length:528 start_codon:yes stop_codon:yes gene_type:complete